MIIYSRFNKRYKKNYKIPAYLLLGILCSCSSISTKKSFFFKNESCPVVEGKMQLRWKNKVQTLTTHALSEYKVNAQNHIIEQKITYEFFPPFSPSRFLNVDIKEREGLSEAYQKKSEYSFGDLDIFYSGDVLAEVDTASEWIRVQSSIYGVLFTVLSDGELLKRNENLSRRFGCQEVHKEDWVRCFFDLQKTQEFYLKLTEGQQSLKDLMIEVFTNPHPTRGHFMTYSKIKISQKESISHIPDELHIFSVKAAFLKNAHSKEEIENIISRISPQTANNSIRWRKLSCVAQ